MIRKLRRKFVLTNMLLVSLVLLVVFGALVVSNYQRLADQSRTAMRAALLWSDEGPDRFEFGASGLLDAPEEGDEKMASRISMVPVFTVTLDENGKPAEVMGGGNVSVSDETVEQAVAQAQGEVPETVREHYAVLPQHGGACVSCGACETRCPFGVPVVQRMEKVKELHLL